MPDAFVVGSGLDHDGLGRNLPGIYRIVEPTAAASEAADTRHFPTSRDGTHA